VGEYDELNDFDYDEFNNFDYNEFNNFYFDVFDVEGDERDEQDVEHIPRRRLGRLLFEERRPNVPVSPAGLKTKFEIVNTSRLFDTCVITDKVSY
jgi:hypothetical protein